MGRDVYSKVETVAQHTEGLLLRRNDEGTKVQMLTHSFTGTKVQILTHLETVAKHLAGRILCRNDEAFRQRRKPPRAVFHAAGTQFTCFTGTRGQILTHFFHAAEGRLDMLRPRRQHA